MGAGCFLGGGHRSSKALQGPSCGLCFQFLLKLFHITCFFISGIFLSSLPLWGPPSWYGWLKLSKGRSWAGRPAFTHQPKNYTNHGSTSNSVRPTDPWRSEFSGQKLQRTGTLGPTTWKQTLWNPEGQRLHSIRCLRSTLTKALHKHLEGLPGVPSHPCYHLPSSGDATATPRKMWWPVYRKTRITFLLLFK